MAEALDELPDHAERRRQEERVAAPERTERARASILRYGPLAVFAARFVAGVRFMAGPLAGSSGLPPWRFLIANLLGAIVYVPMVVGAGYAVGYGVGDRIERWRHAVGDTGRYALIALALAAIAAWIVLALRDRSRS